MDNCLGGRVLGRRKQSIKAPKREQERKDSQGRFCINGKIENKLINKQHCFASSSGHPLVIL